MQSAKCAGDRCVSRRGMRNEMDVTHVTTEFNGNQRDQKESFSTRSVAATIQLAGRVLWFFREKA